MTKRVFNFNPGPAVLPLEVLEQAQAELLDFKGTGMSVMEISHRSKEFEAVIQTAEADLRELLGIPANYKILFLQGGASLQFAMLPMNLRPAGASADYIVTGTWSKTAIKEAQKLALRVRQPIPRRKDSSAFLRILIWIRTRRTCISQLMKPSMAWNSPRNRHHQQAFLLCAILPPISSAVLWMSPNTRLSMQARKRMLGRPVSRW